MAKRREGTHWLKEGDLDPKKPNGKKEGLAPGAHADGDGLYFKVARKGSGRSWILRYNSPTERMPDGSVKRSELGLGSYPKLKLHEARRKAEATLDEMAKTGVDPIIAKRANKAGSDVPVPTFAQALEGALEKRRPKYRASHGLRGKGRMAHTESVWRGHHRKYIDPILKDLPVNVVNTHLVAQILDPLWFGPIVDPKTKRRDDTKAKLPTAMRVRSVIEIVLAWAATKKHRGGPNPAVWRGVLEHIYPAPGDVVRVKHHPAMPYAEIPAFIAVLRALDNNPSKPGPRTKAGPAIEFLIYTAVRTENVLLMRWQDVDWVNKVWVVPALVLKGRKFENTEAFAVPLSEPAMAILRARRPAVADPDAFVFHGKKGPRHPCAPNTLSKALKALGYGMFTNHGFRSSFNNWGDDNEESERVVQAALLHKVVSKPKDDEASGVGAGVIAAYRRNPAFARRIPLMEAWAQFCQPKAPRLELVSSAA